MPRLFITKWAVARGILVVDEKIEKAPTPRGRVDRAWVCLPGMSYSRPLLLNREFFLNLEEARADARERFEDWLKQGKAQTKYAEEALVRFDRGELLVHEPVKNIGRCQAFADLGVHSAGPWVVDPQRLERKGHLMTNDESGQPEETAESLERKDIWVAFAKGRAEYPEDTPCATVDKKELFLLGEAAKRLDPEERFLLYDEAWLRAQLCAPPRRVELKITLLVPDVDDATPWKDVVAARVRAAVSETVREGAQVEQVEFISGPDET